MKNRKHFIREWREFRGMTQAELANESGMSGGNLSRLENFNQEYTQSTLERLAHVLRVGPDELLGVHPKETMAHIDNGNTFAGRNAAKIFRIVGAMSPEAQRRAARILQELS